jgi:hypothetical protein
VFAFRAFKMCWCFGDTLNAIRIFTRRRKGPSSIVLSLGCPLTCLPLFSSLHSFLFLSRLQFLTEVPMSKGGCEAFRCDEAPTRGIITDKKWWCSWGERNLGCISAFTILPQINRTLDSTEIYTKSFDHFYVAL